MEFHQVPTIFHIAICEHLLSNYIQSVSVESSSSEEDDSFVRPVIFNVDVDKYGQDDVYDYLSIPTNMSREDADDLRRSCFGAQCAVGPPKRAKRPASKSYPTLMHCRGMLSYCRKECRDLNMKMCGVWPFLCSKATIDELPDRCRIQCIHNYRQMRLKFPNQPKLPKDANPRFDRFDYY